MRDLPWRSTFDGAFCVGNSFGYLDDPGNAAFLRAVRETLRPGARLVLETPMVLEKKAYGRGRWRKRKGIAWIRFKHGGIHTAEIHWYEAHGIGRKEQKIKRLIS